MRTVRQADTSSPTTPQCHQHLFRSYITMSLSCALPTCSQAPQDLFSQSQSHPTTKQIPEPSATNGGQATLHPSTASSSNPCHQPFAPTCADNMPSSAAQTISPAVPTPTALPIIYYPFTPTAGAPTCVVIQPESTDGPVETCCWEYSSTTTAIPTAAFSAREMHLVEFEPKPWELREQWRDVRTQDLWLVARPLMRLVLFFGLFTAAGWIVGALEGGEGWRWRGGWRSLGWGLRQLSRLTAGVNGIDGL